MIRFCSLIIAFTLTAKVVASPQLGLVAPDFSLTDSFGHQVQLADLRGKTVVLEWTNHDCPFVRKHYQGNMQALQKQLTADPNAVWLSLISSAPGKQGHLTAAQANALTLQRGAAPSAVLFDEQGVVGRLYAAKTTPHMYIIDRKGILRYMGGIDSIASTKPDDLARATPYFANALKAVLADETPKPAVSKPYGCNIKY